MQSCTYQSDLPGCSGFISRTYFLHDLQQDHFHSGFSICADRGDNTRTFFIITTWGLNVQLTVKCSTCHLHTIQCRLHTLYFPGGSDKLCNSLDDELRLIFTLVSQSKLLWNCAAKASLRIRFSAWSFRYLGAHHLFNKYLLFPFLISKYCGYIIICFVSPLLLNIYIASSLFLLCTLLFIFVLMFAYDMIILA